jgi:hypothetical protein
MFSLSTQHKVDEWKCGERLDVDYRGLGPPEKNDGVFALSFKCLSNPYGQRVATANGPKAVDV